MNKVDTSNIDPKKVNTDSLKASIKSKGKTKEVKK